MAQILRQPLIFGQRPKRLKKVENKTILAFENETTAIRQRYNAGKLKRLHSEIKN